MLHQTSPSIRRWKSSFDKVSQIILSERYLSLRTFCVGDFFDRIGSWSVILILCTDPLSSSFILILYPDLLYWIRIPDPFFLAIFLDLCIAEMSVVWDPGQDWIQIFDRLLKHPQVKSKSFEELHCSQSKRDVWNTKYFKGQNLLVFLLLQVWFSVNVENLNEGECDDWKMKECTFHDWKLGLWDYDRV